MFSFEGGTHKRSAEVGGLQRFRLGIGDLLFSDELKFFSYAIIHKFF